MGAGVETGVIALIARGFLLPRVELWGAIRSGGVAGEDSSAARFTPVDLLVFLMVAFEGFIFKFTSQLFSSVERNERLLPSKRHEPQRKAENLQGSNNYFSILSS